jgi:hypothetical protein
MASQKGWKARDASQRDKIDKLNLHRVQIVLLKLHGM